MTEPVSNVLADYYERRAPHYDDVYAVPERQADLERLRELIPALFAGRDVLEVAAGTGYWTHVISATARTVCATDYNPGPLAVAASRAYPRHNVRFDRADAFALDQVSDTFNAASRAAAALSSAPTRRETPTSVASCAMGRAMRSSRTSPVQASLVPQGSVMVGPLKSSSLTTTGCSP